MPLKTDILIIQERDNYAQTENKKIGGQTLQENRQRQVQAQNSRAAPPLIGEIIQAETPVA